MRFPFFTRQREELPRFHDDGIVLRDVGESAQFQQQITDFWNSLQSGMSNPRLIDNVWSANRCIQLNSSAIGSMPLRFFGSREPAWLSSPDPNWFPNGIRSAVYAAVRSLYGWGDAFLYITSRYADGFPSGWTVIDPESMSVRVVNGQREYRVRQRPLDPRDVVQISRTPGAVTGQSALRAYGAPMLSAIASSDLSRAINDSGVPNAVLKPKQKVTAEQAAEIQAAWVTATTSRHGAPAVIPPNIEFETLAFSPKDLMLLDLQQFDARVIATAFGVPPAMLNMPLEGGLTYQNPVQMFEIWWRSELCTTAALVEDGLTSNLLPRGSSVEFDARSFLAPDFKDLVEAYVKLADGGYISRDELRALVLRQPPQSEEESVTDMLTPPVAATSGLTNGDTSSVVPLRPTQEVSV